MNNKRWIAVVLGILILLVSTMVPKFETIEQEKLLENYSKMFGIENFLSGSSGKTEEIIEEGSENERVAVISLEGTIMAKAPYGPGYTHEDLIDQLKTIQEDDTVKAVLFVLNTGGGTIFESEEIRQEIIKIKEKGLPIYASMKNMAASGGYYIASETDKIFAYPDTITGSIGVVMQSVDTTGLQEKIGVEIVQYTAGDLKRVDNKDDEATRKKQDEVFQAYVNEGYERFVEIVANGRGMDVEDVKKLADGRIYTAKQALGNGLIDQMGTTEEAIESLITDAGLTNPEVFKYAYKNPYNFPGFLGMSAGNELETFEDLLQNFQNRAPHAYYIYGGE